MDGRSAASITRPRPVRRSSLTLGEDVKKGALRRLIAKKNWN